MCVWGGAAEFAGSCGKEGLVRWAWGCISSQPDSTRLNLRSIKELTKSKRGVFKYVVKKFSFID